MAIERSVFWLGPVNKDNFEKVAKGFLELLKSDHQKEIHLFISSLGGPFDIALTFYEAVRIFDINLTTYALASLDSSSLLLFLTGKQRVCGSHSTIMLQSNSQIFERESSIGFGADRSWRDEGDFKRNRFAKLVCDRTGGVLSPETVLDMMEQQTLILPERALAYGLATKIFTEP